jgi:hypothetical protein
MTRSRTKLRAVGILATFAVAIFIVGCQDGDSPQGWDTNLPPGVSAVPATFQQAIGTVVPLGQRRVRTRNATCEGCTVEVAIQAIYNTRTLRPDSAPATGIAVARIQNLDSTRTESYYGFKPSTQAEYYLWFDKRPESDSARITVLEVPMGGGAVRAGNQKNVGYCHIHPPGYAGPPDADFLEYKPPCTVAAAGAAAKINTASVFSAGKFGDILARIAALVRSPPPAPRSAWIDCNSGCCT